MRPVRFLALLVPFSLVLLAAFLTMSNAHSQGPTLPGASPAWPPAAADIVSINSNNMQLPDSLQSHAEFVLYQVPQDAYLVVTGLAASGGSPNLILAEDFGGAVKYKSSLAGPLPSNGGTLPSQSPGPLGWTFRPSSNVVVQNAAANPTPFGSVRFELIGYLCRSGAASTSCWPPAAADMVSISSNSMHVPASLPGNGEFLLFQVPQDTYLIVTGFAAIAPGPGFQYLALEEDLGGALSFKASFNNGSTGDVVPGISSGPMGWTFRPGSKVVIRNTSANATTFGTPGPTRFSLIGYLCH